MTRTHIKVDSKSLGQRVIAAREKRGWTRYQLAEKTGVNYMTISTVEHGYNTPSLGLYLVIARALGFKKFPFIE